VDTPLARARGREVSAIRFAQIAAASALSLYLIVISGALVRLTGSGLGCESWPGCREGAFFPESDHHSFIEFGNRAMALFPIAFSLAAWIAAPRTRGLPRWASWLAAAVFLGTIAQAPLGLLTIRLDLHPLMVAIHFLLALVVLAGAVVLGVEAWANRSGRAARPVAAWVPRLGLVLVAACAVLVVTGTLSTAAGPHPGSVDIDRYGDLLDSVWLHVRATAVFGLSFLVLLVYLVRTRDRTRPLLVVALGLLALLLAQMVVGEIQWRTQLPWGVVLVHVALAAAVWAWTVGFVAVLWRAPAPLGERV
jgi:cytochrome c oxidase assembly protein subunit 15